ncbi:hypothetical protein RSOLAG22IIIB_01023 [Rhizoctonia solani]|uniref:DNA-binding protein RAP1 n=1 Tax=Rhizoctonia solani TaxID=456999 RepID=A0A0K6G1J1_9AGAM|nr:hypothetical protein RSOLAG22IIIB_01023 [Rhizoctonia solani]
MSNLIDNVATAVFFDPVLRRVAKIYLDTKHLPGQIYIRLRSIIENGGGRITPLKEAASIWIVDPEAPNALGDPPLHITILYAPWLIACSRKGCFLGAEHGDWCGFRVPLREDSPHPLAYPEPEPTPAPNLKPQPSHVPFGSEQPIDHSRTRLNVAKWSRVETNEAFKYPSIVPPVPIWSIDFTGCPTAPDAHTLGVLNGAGKRKYTDTELAWMTDIIQWCLGKYPDMPLTTVIEVLARKGSHRTAMAYDVHLRRYLGWFAERAPLLAERLQNYAETLAHAPIELSDSESSSQSMISRSRPSIQDSRELSSVARGFVTDPKSTKFTDADRAAFIRFAAARPSGMDPTGMERATDVWAQFARMYPHHSTSSWRTWHQHWRNDLKQAVEEYREANSE